jgi:hypothetical protein
MDRPKLEVADIFRRYGEPYRRQHGALLSMGQRRVMTAIEVCRTATLGGHLERCDSCGYERPCYDSCRNRHCPKCQSLARAEWVEKRTSEVLPTHYFHVVFSVPEQIASVAYQNKEVVYGILFRATAETLSTIAADPKPSATGVVGTAGSVASDDRGIDHCRRERSWEASRGVAADDASGRGAADGTGLCAGHRNSGAVSMRQAAG